MAAYLQAAQPKCSCHMQTGPSTNLFQGLLGRRCLQLRNQLNTTQPTVTGDCSSKVAAYFQPLSETATNTLLELWNLHAYAPKPLLAVLCAMHHRVL